MLQNFGGVPITLILFAGIAIFLGLRLRSILGRRVGFEKPPVPPGQMPGFGNGPIIEGRAFPAQPGRAVPDPRSALGERLMQIVNRDPIDDAELIGDQAAIIVRFTSDQVNLTLDASGTPLVGTEAVTELTDLWTFERNLKSKDLTWRLAAARSG
jgi:predicted lipid-binding transport protein (Tim44 family)